MKIDSTTFQLWIDVGASVPLVLGLAHKATVVFRTAMEEGYLARPTGRGRLAFPTFYWPTFDKSSRI